MDTGKQNYMFLFSEFPQSTKDCRNIGDVNEKRNGKINKRKKKGKNERKQKKKSKESNKKRQKREEFVRFFQIDPSRGTKNC